MVWIHNRKIIKCKQLIWEFQNSAKFSSSSGKAIGYGLDGPGSISEVAGMEIFSLLCLQTGPGIYSASYKMSTGAFPGGNGAWA